MQGNLWTLLECQFQIEKKRCLKKNKYLNFSHFRFKNAYLWGALTAQMAQNCNFFFELGARFISVLFILASASVTASASS